MRRFSRRLKILLGVFAALLVILLTRPLWRPFFERVAPLDPVPASCGSARLERREGHVVLHLAGSPEEMGRQHGELLKESIGLMLREYVAPRARGRMGEVLEEALPRVRAALPEDFLRELDACAGAAGVDADDLLLAQCIGDVKEAAVHGRRSGAGCSAYVAFGPAAAGGGLECGRNLDYELSAEVARRCSLVTYYAPEDGHRFAAVGLAGMLTGWTLINEHGLVVANHLGGGTERRLEAMPTLILARRVAQRAATVEEGIGIIRASSRMRGQIIWLAQEGDPASGRPARAAAVEYDAETVAVREAENGVLIVTNTNRVLGGRVADGDVGCPRYRRLRELVDARLGSLDGGEPLTLDPGVARADGWSQHVVHFAPRQGFFRVWHLLNASGLGRPVEHPAP